MLFARVKGRGGREHNEDAVGNLIKGDMSCFVLADGLGGHGKGEVASELAVKTVLECFDAQAEVSKDMLYSYMEAAQNAIIDKRKEDPECAKMGTTLVVLLMNRDFAVWGHCGDSRIYRLKNKKIEEISNDHSVAFSSFMAGEISYDQIRTSPDQNRLLRSLSDGEKFIPDISDVTPIGKKTAFVLCSDGFWEYVDELFIMESLKKNKSAKEWLKVMLEERERKAPDNADNYSAITVIL